jgi:hypothetical protein
LCPDSLRIHSSSNKILLVELKVAIVVGTLGNIFRVRALSVIKAEADLENGSQWAAVLTRSASNADKVLAAVFWVCVLGENSSSLLGRTLESSFLNLSLLLLFAALDLICPLADAILGIKGEAGGTGVPVGEAIPAVEEGGAVLGIQEGSVQPGVDFMKLVWPKFTEKSKLVRLIFISMTLNGVYLLIIPRSLSNILIIFKCCLWAETCLKFFVELKN